MSTIANFQSAVAGIPSAGVMAGYANLPEASDSTNRIIEAINKALVDAKQAQKRELTLDVYCFAANMASIQLAQIAFRRAGYNVLYEKKPSKDLIKLSW